MEHDVSKPLHMVQLWLETRRLVALGHMLGLLKPHRPVSTAYLVHCALGELFQDQAPGPFCLEDGPDRLTPAGPDGPAGSYVRVLGYAGVDGPTLQEIARGFASPAVYEISRWDRCASKPMPGTFPRGMKLRFELRACPIVRKSAAGTRWTEGQEVDAFLDRVWQVNDPNVTLNREDVYREWLDRQVDLRGGARILASQVDRFSLDQMTRRTQGDHRKAVNIQRPDVTFTGALEVTGDGSFKGLLQQGIGRHKSFGFGMLKIRRL